MNKSINKSPIFIFRSVQSVPMLAAAASAASIPPMSHTWDGEPCPVHHQHAVPLAALYGLGPQMMGGPASVPPSVISGATTVRRARSIGIKFIVIFWWRSVIFRSTFLCFSILQKANEFFTNFCPQPLEWVKSEKCRNFTILDTL